MANQNTVWVVIATSDAIDKLREYIDSGYLGEAQSIHYQLQALNDKMNKLLAEKGGRVLLSTYDRIILEMTSTTAEEIPAIMVGYQQFFGSKIAIGIGMDLSEASAAANKSAFTNEIELYDPADETFKSEFYKNDQDPFQLPPNLFDPNMPKVPEPQEKRPRTVKDKPVIIDAQTAMQADNAMMQAIMQQISPPPPQMPPQQQQKPEEEQPRDLLEALHGEQVDGHNPDEDKKDAADKSPKKDSKDKDSENKDSKKDDKDDDSQDKIASLLAMVQDKMPKLMQLSDSNPEAFKKVVALVHKLVDVAKTKKTNKSEVEDLTDQLNKAIRIRYPVGTRLGRKKKVLINGKEVWRSMASGQVKDPKGEPVSVKSSNASADDGQEGVREQ